MNVQEKEDQTRQPASRQPVEQYEDNQSKGGKIVGPVAAATEGCAPLDWWALVRGQPPHQQQFHVCHQHNKDSISSAATTSKELRTRFRAVSASVG
jgi:hypothetical protein